MQSRSLKVLQVVAIAGVLGAAGATRAAEPVRADATCPVVEKNDAASSGAAAGAYAGTIVDLSCDSVRLTLSAAQCDDGEHIYALKIDGSKGLHPLVLTGTPPGAERLRAGDFTGKQVRVAGTRYPTHGGIVVSDICMLG